MAPSRSSKWRSSILYPGARQRVEDVATGQETLCDAAFIVPTDNHHAPIVKKGSCTAGTTLGHWRSTNPAAVPGVEDLDCVQGAIFLIATAKGIQHVGQETIEAQEGADGLHI